jgi:hypothetical protein
MSAPWIFSGYFRQRARGALTTKNLSATRSSVNGVSEWGQVSPVKEENGKLAKKPGK